MPKLSNCSTCEALSHGLSTLKGSTVQLECPETVTESRSLSWYIRSGSNSIIYTINSDINPSLQSDLHQRLNITGNHTIGEYHLSISDVRESDEGTYECSISGTINRYRVKLTVVVEPYSVNTDNVLPDDKLQGTEGLDLIITCRAVGGKPTPDVKLLISGSIAATGKQSLQHTLSTISSSYDLKPLPPLFLQKSVVTEDTVPLNVSCTSHDSRPAANFTWLIGQNNKDVTINSSESRTLNSSTETFTVTSMLIYRVDRAYNGHVTCEARNIISSNASSSALLNIKRK
ncbi:unnamed protein product [Mytilus coruscus]|uniref:Ig-like domain-containing protein n=1 Tax=Mytilus coruscus TaxID=42192 RepID=A0A6J8CY41_MYTCO|nr:unnamed protein product [Mytilus coruscus]